MLLTERLSNARFRLVHGNNLVYNTCWEDPRLDRVALDLRPDDTVLVITSAGCNALDYALAGPRHVHAVDMNPRQNALLDLKLAGIRELEFAEFFDLFGRGRVAGFDGMYRNRLRPALPDASRAFWDKHLDFFDGRGARDSFYFRGTTGLLAYLVKLYVDRVPRLRESLDSLLAAESLAAQQTLYFGGVRERFWRGFVRWLIGQDAVLSLLGVPRPQREQVERHYGGGIADFVIDCLDAVFAHLPLHDNYFWRVYLRGEYSPGCCPEYLKESNFNRLRDGLAERVSTHTATVEGFLRSTPIPISRFVLLDHMDWLSTHARPALAAEWQAIVDNAAPGARAIWRSGGMTVGFVDPIEVSLAGTRHRIGELLQYQHHLARELHAKDRVHTYGSFYIADLAIA